MLYKSLGIVRPTFRGQYKNSEVYNKLDIVSTGSGSYVCNGYLVSGITPSSNEDLWIPLFKSRNYTLRWLFAAFNESEGKINDWDTGLTLSTNKLENNNVTPYYIFCDPLRKSRIQISDASEKMSTYWRFNKTFGEDVRYIGVYVGQAGKLRIQLKIDYSQSTEHSVGSSYYWQEVDVDTGWNVIDIRTTISATDTNFNICLCPITCKLWIYNSNGNDDKFCPFSTSITTESGKTVEDNFQDYTSIRIPFDLGIVNDRTL